MRIILNLIITLVIIAPCVPVYFTFTIAAIMTLDEQNQSVLANLTPFISLILAVILIKLIYKFVNYCGKLIFPSSKE